MEDWLRWRGGVSLEEDNLVDFVREEKRFCIWKFIRMIFLNFYEKKSNKEKKKGKILLIFCGFQKILKRKKNVCFFKFLWNLCFFFSTC